MMTHHGEGKTRSLLIISMIVVLIALLVFPLLQNCVKEQPVPEEAIYHAALDIEPQSENCSFYQKLADGFDVNILIAGDSISAGSGATDTGHRWVNLLKEKLESTYCVPVNLTNVSIRGATSYAGYVQTKMLDDNISYDLAILCFGQNDSKKNFTLYYESIIHTVKLRYPRASIICILESSQKEYTEKIQAIHSIADHYGLPIVDMIAPFRANYDDLVGDNVHPNDDGQQVYCETIMNTIDSLVTARHGFDPENVALLNNQVTTFDPFQWFPMDQFAREGNTFTLAGPIHGIILGIDYDYTPGDNICQILIDGMEYATHEVTYNHDFSQRHIVVLNNWQKGDDVLNVQSEIKVVFGEGEEGKNQADGFRGLAISG